MSKPIEYIDSSGPESSELVRKPYLRSEHSAEHGMNLPDGKTCGDCLHLRRCQSIYGRVPFDEVCDWAPSRFKDARQYFVSLVSNLSERDRSLLAAAIGRQLYG